MIQCSRCIMDTTDPFITFDDEGVCNHCVSYDKRIENETYFRYGLEKEKEHRLRRFVKQVKVDGGCIMGLSGGMDSSYALCKLANLGIKPFGIVYDNGWNTHTADHNISTLISHFDLKTEVVKVNQEIYRDVQIAFLKSGVMNAEIPTDHFLAALLYHYADKLGYRYIIHGGNIQTEGIMPSSWGYDAQDWKHIVSVYREHGELGVEKLRTLPHMNLLDWFKYTFIKRVKWFPILNYYFYDPVEAYKELMKIGWRPYGLKHTESIYTAVFQQYILPRKFGIDKRKAHFSSLINAGLMTRNKAIEEMQQPMFYDNPSWVEYVCKQLKIKRGEFDYWMSQNPVPHECYGSNRALLRLAKPLVSLARRTATVSA